MLRKTLSLLMILTAPAAFGQTVTLTLTSSKNGLTVTAGTAIDWTISFTDSTGDNQGLALLCVDLTQDPNNPAKFDIPKAAAAPSGMAKFARPQGVTNPNEGGINGYQGVQRGTAGSKNLLQIGGAQNTFGTARTAGSGVAENANVSSGIGQSGSTSLANGNFNAPSTAGTYTYSLANGFANVLVQRNSPPAISTVKQATVAVSGGSFTFTVGGSVCTGDLNGDNHVDLSDLAALLANYGLASGATYSQGDLNGDGKVDLSDLAALLAVFGNNC